MAAEFNLGKIIGAKPKGFDSIYQAIISQIASVDRDYLLRLLKFLARHNVIDINNREEFSASLITPFLNDEHPELIVSQGDWCRSANLLEYLAGQNDEFDQLVSISLSANLKDLQLILESSPKDMVLLFSKFHLISRALHTIAQINLISYMKSDRILDVELILASLKISFKQFDRLMKILELLKLSKKSQDIYKLSKILVSVLGDAPQTIQPAFCMVDNAWWNSVSELKHSILTRQSAFQKANNMNFFQYLDVNPDQRRKFDIGLGCFSKNDDEIVAEKFDFSTYKSIVDVAGGYGSLLWEIYSRDTNFHHELTLYDTEQVMNNIHNQLRKLDKTVFISCPGNFFESSDNAQIPRGKDLYIIKGVLHDFTDAQCVTVLKNINDAMSENSRLLVIERSLSSGEGIDSNYFSDMLMLVLLDGRERSLEEWLALYKMCGFLCDNAASPSVVGDFSMMLCRKYTFFSRATSQSGEILEEKSTVDAGLFSSK
ncbi:MAG: hypothetical protein K2X50_01010 [Gammaproteobacteria bacterium]|nr:hypothetical protein [Gammaproteobacteria bacterium]